MASGLSFCRSAVLVPSVLIVVLGLSSAVMAQSGGQKPPPDYFLATLAATRSASALAHECGSLDFREEDAEAAFGSTISRMRADGYGDADFTVWSEWLEETGFTVVVAEYFAERGLDFDKAAPDGEKAGLIAKACALGEDEAESNMGAGKYLSVAR